MYSCDNGAVNLASPALKIRVSPSVYSESSVASDNDEGIF